MGIRDAFFAEYSIFSQTLSTPGSFYDLLSPAFFERAAERLLLVDCQPKNIMLGESGKLTFMDIDYMSGNAALGVGPSIPP